MKPPEKIWGIQSIYKNDTDERWGAWGLDNRISDFDSWEEARGWVVMELADRLAQHVQLLRTTRIELEAYRALAEKLSA